MSPATDLGCDGETRGGGVGEEEIAVGVFLDVGPVRGGRLGFPCVVGFAGWVDIGGVGGWRWWGIVGGHDDDVFRSQIIIYSSRN